MYTNGLAKAGKLRKARPNGPTQSRFSDQFQIDPARDFPGKRVRGATRPAGRSVVGGSGDKSQ